MSAVLDAGDDDARYRAVYRNGSGYKAIYLEEWRELGSNIVGIEPDGSRHLWSAGADLHIKEVEP